MIATEIKSTKTTFSNYCTLKTCFLLLLVLFSFSIHAQNEDEKVFNNFDGIYIGAMTGVQNLFGGSFVNGIDVLAQESRFVLEFPVGFRKQFLNERLMAGIEFQFGITDGDLKHSDPAEELEITYENSTQWGYGLTLGYVLGAKRNILAFMYGNETKRTFDVSIKEGGLSYKQNDKQGMLKYGFGLEASILSILNIRATAGWLRVDFGDLITNIDVEDKMDYMVGVILQF